MIIFHKMYRYIPTIFRTNHIKLPILNYIGTLYALQQLYEYFIAQ